ncbi:hypothetical protein [Gorillibacterium timonense]|uniref:hypothetical protein n=1 Tax=Gorillibacterium timonense TaxID=1689269 RepID=UPI00071C44A8|nr:hypothetical protein [Gorillibacterium timonense]
MPVFRSAKTGEVPFVRIDRPVVQDERLSWKARGLLAYMLSKPDNFKFHLEELVNHAPDGLDSVKSGVKELSKYGYVKRYPIKEKGKIVAWEMEVYEQPSPQVDFPLVGKPPEEKPLEGNPMLSTKDIRTTDLRTKDKKDYIDFPIDAHRFLKIYDDLFYSLLGKHHMRVSPDSLNFILENMELLDEFEITDEQFHEAAEDHLMFLTDTNNGSVIAFIHTFRRRFDIPHTGEPY